eukprot:m51a1_g2709 hypothetical protein (399) ;mRNA; f:821338-822904
MAQSHANLSDISVVFPDQCPEPTPAHSFVLASNSPVFRVMLFGNLAESHSKEIRITESSRRGFLNLLRCIYGVSDVPLTVADGLELLRLLHMYDVRSPIAATVSLLSAHTSADNVLEVLETAELLGVPALLEACAHVVETDACRVLGSDRVLALKPAALQSLLSLPTLRAPEMHVLRAALRWVCSRPPSELGDQAVAAVLAPVCLSRIPHSDLVAELRKVPLEAVSALVRYELLSSLFVPPPTPSSSEGQQTSRTIDELAVGHATFEYTWVVHSLMRTVESQSPKMCVGPESAGPFFTLMCVLDPLRKMLSLSLRFEVGKVCKSVKASVRVVLRRPGKQDQAAVRRWAFEQEFGEPNAVRWVRSFTQTPERFLDADGSAHFSVSLSFAPAPADLNQTI